MRCPLRGSVVKANGNKLIKQMLMQLVLAVLISAARAGAHLPPVPSQLDEEVDASAPSGDIHSIGPLDEGENGRARFRRSILSSLGKRITTSLVAELGKRPRQLYSFGIGKRSISERDMADFLAEEAEKGGKKEGAHTADQLMRARDELDHSAAMLLGTEKRGSHSPLFGGENFEFGHKRDPYAFGLGKRDAYSFGLGRRDPYSFGLGKRADAYGFGLGKRGDPYDFGLGKRADPYGFGLGKRGDPYDFGLGKREPYSFGLGKRDPYSFGLGKRSSNLYASESGGN